MPSPSGTRTPGEGAGTPGPNLGLAEGSRPTSADRLAGLAQKADFNVIKREINAAVRNRQDGKSKGTTRRKSEIRNPNAEFFPVSPRL
jgi:hypothetical protein